MSSGNCVTPGTTVSVSTSVKWGYKALPSLLRRDAKMGLLDLGLQRPMNCPTITCDAVGAFCGKEVPWFSSDTQGAQNSLGKMNEP